MFEAAVQNFGPVHNFEPPTVIADAVSQAARVFSLASVGHVTGHMVSHMVPMPAAILENSRCEQLCYGFLGLLKFCCSQTLPNFVNCLLIIFFFVWHAKDFAQIKITNGKMASNWSNRNAIMKNFEQPLFNIPPLNTPWQSSTSCALDVSECLLIQSIRKGREILFSWDEKPLNHAHFASCQPAPVSAQHFPSLPPGEQFFQGVQRSGKSQGNSRLGKSQGILLKVREKMNIGKSQGICI